MFALCCTVSSRERVRYVDICPYVSVVNKRKIVTSILSSLTNTCSM